MAQFTLSQLARAAVLSTGSASVASSIVTAPVISAVSVGAAVTFTVAVAVGVPTPVLVHNLYKNGSLFISGYTSGAYTAVTANDTLFIRAVASNGVGTTAVQDSNTVTIGASATAAPIIGAAAVVQPVTAGVGVTFTAASSISGIPAPTVTNDLYKNGALLTAGYASGSYTGAVAGDTFFIRTTATNTVTAVTKDSVVVTASAAPVAGAPVWTAQAPQPVYNGWPYMYPLAATSATSFELSAGTLPAGMTLNATTGLISNGVTLYPLPTTAQPYPAPGAYTVSIDAVNASGRTTSTMTFNVAWRPEVIPVIAGSPAHFVIPGYYDPSIGLNGALDAVQWYKNANDGNGPVAISGATSATYVYQDADVGTFPSVHVTIGGAVYKSGEFTVAGPGVEQQVATPLVSATVLTNGIGGGLINAGATLYAPTFCRYQSGSAYMEQVLAPGIYGSYSGKFGPFANLNPYGGNPSIKLPTLRWAPGPVMRQRGAFPTTATRPTASGAGFFCANGTVYDPTGKEFRMRGINRNHWDAGMPGAYNTGMNVCRQFTDFTKPWATMQPVLQDMLNHGVVPMVTFAGGPMTYSATINNDVMTLGAMDATGGSVPISDMPSGSSYFCLMTPTGTDLPTLLPPLIYSFGTATITSRSGTYNLRHQPFTSATTMFLGSGSAAATDCKFTGTISQANVLTVTAVDGANTSQLTVGRNVWINGKTCAVIGSLGTGTGGVGTYNLTLAISVTSNFKTNAASSGCKEPSQMLAAAVMMCDQFTDRYSSIQDKMILNIANEWGPVGTSTNTVWRDSYVTAIGLLRAAGYTCPIVVDCPGAGQDDGLSLFTVQRDAGAVYGSDPLANTIISFHHYGAASMKFPGALYANAMQTMKAVNQAQGVPFVLGEFGAYHPAVNPGSDAVHDPRESIASAESCCFGWLAWAWDDPAGSNDSYSYNMAYLSGSYNAGGGGFSTKAGFPNGNPAELTPAGQAIVLDPYLGIRALAVKAQFTPAI